MEDIPDQIETGIDCFKMLNPEGVGETATPMVACAIANSFLALDWKEFDGIYLLTPEASFWRH